VSIRMILADDHNVFRNCLSRSFEQEDDIDIIGQADNGLSAIDLVRELSPDIVVMDIGMPDMNGVEATRQIIREWPSVKVIGLSMHSSDKYVREMFRAGASGYLLKNCTFDELIEAVRTVAQGKIYVSPSVGETVIKNYIGQSDCEPSVFSILSERERQVLQLVAEGKTTRQIAQQLHISPKTVEAHRLHVMNKLDIDNIAQLTKYAIQAGLTQAEP